MIGRQKTYSVQLTEEEKKLLQQLGLARKTGQSKARRAKVIIKVDENPDWTDAQIAGEIGCSSGLVRKWRQYGSDKHFSLSLGSGERVRGKGERMYSKPFPFTL